MNIIFSGFIHPILGVITGILLSIGTENLGKLILKRYYPSFFFLNLVFGITAITLISYIFILLNISNLVNVLLSYTLILLGIHRCIRLLSLQHLNLKLDFFRLSILLLLLLLLFISISPPSMSDSLAYHLGVAKYIFTNNNWPNPNMWLHGNIAGFGEVFNTLGLYVYSDKAGTIVQFLGLSSFLIYFSNKIENNEIKIIFNLFILSSPIIVFLLSGSKFLILPQLTTALILYILIKNKFINNKNFFLIVFLLCGVSNFKLNFLISGSILGLFALTKIKLNFKIIGVGLIIIIIFFLPKILFNYQYIYDFKLLHLISNIPDEFIKTIRNYRESKLIFPLNLFFFDSFGQIGRLLGFGIFILIFLKKFTNESKLIFTIIFVTSFLYFYFSMSTSRMFFEMLLWSSIVLLFNPTFRINFNIIKYFLSINLIFTILLSLIGSFNLSKGLINNNFRSKVMSINSYEYNGAKWINEEINPDKTIITNLRSLSLLNMDVIPMDYLQYNLSDKKLIPYKNYLMSKNIEFLVLRDYEGDDYLKYKFNYFFSNCAILNKIKSPNFYVEKRNPFNRKLKYNITIIKFKKNVNECVN